MACRPLSLSLSLSLCLSLTVTLSSCLSPLTLLPPRFLRPPSRLRWMVRTGVAYFTVVFSHRWLPLASYRAKAKVVFALTVPVVVSGGYWSGGVSIVS